MNNSRTIIAKAQNKPQYKHMKINRLYLMVINREVECTINAQKHRDAHQNSARLHKIGELLFNN